MNYFLTRKSLEIMKIKQRVNNWWCKCFSLCFLQMCDLLHYFCDCELRHRIESIVSFSDGFVSKLQFNQKFRYNELMLALNMSAAVTAKKTKEFRSPPQEQVHSHLFIT